MSAPYLLMHRNPSGGLGNQLFQYNFLAQLAHSSKVNFLHCGFPKLSYFDIQKESKWKSKIFSMGSMRISLETIEKRGWEQTIDEMQQTFSIKKSVSLNPGILGEYYKEVTNLDPKAILKLYSKKSDDADNQLLAVHFRGTDFHQWNPRAVMNLDFYHDAVALAKQKNRGLNRIKVFTDDGDSETVSQLVRTHGAEISCGSEIEDFEEMMGAYSIVASPSTFVFWSAVLGNCKEIFYSREWLDYASESKYKFWIDLRNGLLPYFPKVMEV
jgi:hypothetical protein